MSPSVEDYSQSPEVAGCSHVGVETGPIAHGDGVNGGGANVARQESVDETEPWPWFARVTIEVDLPAIAEIRGAVSLLKEKTRELSPREICEQTEHSNGERIRVGDLSSFPLDQEGEVVTESGLDGVECEPHRASTSTPKRAATSESGTLSLARRSRTIAVISSSSTRESSWLTSA